MNFFFGINNEEFSSEIQIPTFQNRNPKCTNISLYKASIEQKMWKIEKLNSNKINDNFYIVKGDEITNYDAYFLANDEDLVTFKNDKLNDFNKFTDTTPSFRCNFKIYLNEGGFSSYQSEYPFEMTLKNGNIFSSVSTLLNNEAEENYILFRNIFHKPRIERFNIYFINIKTEKILKIEDAYSNTSNLIFVDKDLINKDVYIFSDSFLGIPIFISKNRNHLSMEHTHPPHHYILSDNKFKIIRQIKNEIKNNIIQQIV